MYCQNTNTYAGATTLSGGTLEINSLSNALGTGTLNLNGGTLTSIIAGTASLGNSSLAVGGNAAIGGSNSITFANTANANTLASGDTLTISNTGTTTFNNLI